MSGASVLFEPEEIADGRDDRRGREGAPVQNGLEPALLELGVRGADPIADLEKKGLDAEEVDVELRREEVTDRRLSGALGAYENDDLLPAPRIFRHVGVTGSLPVLCRTTGCGCTCRK